LPVSEAKALDLSKLTEAWKPHNNLPSVRIARRYFFMQKFTEKALPYAQ
jgi:hypothetical protein